MPTSSQWLAFIIASILFIQVPGPSLLFTIGRALTVGRREALLSVVGNALGLVVQVGFVALGIGAVVAASAMAYTVLKLVGAAYVVWLGVSAIRHRADARLALQNPERPPATRAKAVRTGFVVGVTNPKTIVFFAAFLPQFTSDSGPAALQSVLLGIVFGILAVCSDSVWALGAGKARDWFARKPHRLDKLSASGGGMMITLGVTLAASE
ncbi:MAG TPA: LysE family translocator [Nocardioidaceae bacterium]|nr:LysE family translocator [Nocardioidaceae bacterium]